jgi:hypothetical protein
MLARKGEEPAPDVAQVSPHPRHLHHEIALGYELGGNWRSGLVHGPRVGYAYAWKSIAITAGGALELSGRTLASQEEKLVGGYGRAGIEVRLPLGALVVRAGPGLRAGVISQALAPIAGTTVPGPVAEASKAAFVFGPDLVVGARTWLAPSWFVDVAGTGSIAFLREEGSLRGVPALTGGASVGATF